MIMKRMAELNIDLNAKANDGFTAFHLACINGHEKIVEMIMRYSAELKIDLNTKTLLDGLNFINWSRIDLNARDADIDGWTPFKKLLIWMLKRMLYGLYFEIID